MNLIFSPPPQAYVVKRNENKTELFLLLGYLYLRQKKIKSYGPLVAVNFIFKLLGNVFSNENTFKVK